MPAPNAAFVVRRSMNTSTPVDPAPAIPSGRVGVTDQHTVAAGWIGTSAGSGCSDIVPDRNDRVDRVSKPGRVRWREWSARSTRIRTAPNVASDIVDIWRPGHN